MEIYIFVPECRLYCVHGKYLARVSVIVLHGKYLDRVSVVCAWEIPCPCVSCMTYIGNTLRMSVVVYKGIPYHMMDEDN